MEPSNIFYQCEVCGVKHYSTADLHECYSRHEKNRELAGEAYCNSFGHIWVYKNLYIDRVCIRSCKYCQSEQRIGHEFMTELGLKGMFEYMFGENKPRGDYSCGSI